MTTGVGAGLYLEFSTTDGEAVTAKVGVSYTSVDNARQNRLAEARTLSFDKAKVKALKTWEDYWDVSVLRQMLRPIK